MKSKSLAPNAVVALTKKPSPVEPAAEGFKAMQRVDAESKRYVEIIDGYTIPDDDEYEAAGELAKKIAQLEKQVLEQYALAVGDLKAQVAKHDAFFSPIKARLKESKAKLKTMIAGYMLEKRRQAKELAAAAVAAPVTATGASTSKALLSQAREAAAPSVTGISGAVKMKWSLVDFNAVPDEFKMVVLNEKAIDAAVKAGTTEIPGLDIVEDIGVRITTGRAK
jgi:hypothetical protein